MSKMLCQTSINSFIDTAVPVLRQHLEDYILRWCYSGVDILPKAEEHIIYDRAANFMHVCAYICCPDLSLDSYATNTATALYSINSHVV